MKYLNVTLQIALAAAVSLTVTAAAPPSRSATGTSLAIDVAKGSCSINPYSIDLDGDGYGVACKRGPDADDTDPDVNTPASVTARYGDLKTFLAHRGYRPRRMFFISTDGSDRMGVTNDAARAFATWKKVHPLVRQQDVVIFREGTYSADTVIDCRWPPLIGAPALPVVLMAYPGERVVLEAKGSCIFIGRSRHVVFDGFVLAGSHENWSNGVFMHDSRNITFRNIEASGHQRGIIAMEDLHDILIENCIFHDNPHSHGIYLGSRQRPNTNLTIRNCLIYRNGRHGIQHNGRVKNLLIDTCAIHSNTLGGIAMLEGVSNSTVTNTLIFNNNKQGIVFYLYDDSDPAIQPYDQTDNTITGNIIWVGDYRWSDGEIGPKEHPAVHFNDDTAARSHCMKGNVFRNNILVTSEGPVFRFDQPRDMQRTVIENNMMYRKAGAEMVITCGSMRYDMAAFERLNSLFRNNSFSRPRFAGVSSDYYKTPQRFDFSRFLPLEGTEP